MKAIEAMTSFSWQSFEAQCVAGVPGVMLIAFQGLNVKEEAELVGSESQEIKLVRESFLMWESLILPSFGSVFYHLCEACFTPY